MKPMAHRRRKYDPTCIEAAATLLIIIGCILVYIIWVPLLGG